MAATCPKAQIPKNVRMVTNQPKREMDTEANLWTRVLTLKDTVAATQGSTPYARSVGPVYKVNITVEGIPTRAFLDHGSQVTIVHRQLLPMILEKNSWSTEKCKSKNIPLKAQPVGGMGKELGTSGMVSLQMEIDETGQNLNWGQVPTFIKKNSLIGRIESVDLVSNEDPHCNAEQTDSDCTVRTCQLGEGERDSVLKEQLRIGDAATGKAKEELIHVLAQLSKHLHSVMMN